MTTINLLPWRQERREEQKKEFFIMLGIGAVCAFIFSGYLHFMYSNWMDVQNQRNRFLQQEIKVLDQRIEKIAAIKQEKQKLLSRMEVIQSLQQNRPDIVRLFNSIVEVVPGGLYYLVIKRRDKEITIEGRGESNTRVSKLMRKMASSKNLGDPRLSVIKAQQDKKGSAQTENFFNLRVKQLDQRK